MSVLEVRAEVVGTIVAVDCLTGALVEEGAPLLAIESMKMEYPIVAPAAGSVAQINVSVGDVVEENQVLVLIRP